MMAKTIRRPARAGRIIGVALSILLVGAVVPVSAVTIAPGSSVVLDVADDATCEEVKPPQTSGTFGEGCVNASPTPSCVVDAGTRTLKVDAGIGDSCLVFATAGPDVTFPDGPIRSGSAIARLINTFEIEPPVSQPAAETLPVQISTEVIWDGTLFPLAATVPIFSQVIATLQVRDTTTQEVVASNTFLFERSGPTGAEDLILSCNPVPNCSFNNPANHLISLANSTGADLTAHLLRGREYAVEVEAKCNHQGNYFFFLGHVGVSGFFGGCFFGAGETDILNAQLNNIFSGGVQIPSDGFTVAPITVTVGPDLKAGLAAALVSGSSRDDDDD